MVEITVTAYSNAPGKLHCSCSLSPLYPALWNLMNNSPSNSLNFFFSHFSGSISLVPFLLLGPFPFLFQYPFLFGGTSHFFSVVYHFPCLHFSSLSPPSSATSETRPLVGVDFGRGFLGKGNTKHFELPSLCVTQTKPPPGRCNGWQWVFLHRCAITHCARCVFAKKLKYC